MHRTALLVAVSSLAALVLALASCSGAACKGFCELDCKRIIKCDGGASPTGAQYDACVNSCVDAVRAAGAKDDRDCNCCTPSSSNFCDGGQKTCDNEPVSRWSKTYTCP